MIVHRGQMAGHSAAEITLRRGLPRQTPTAIGRVIRTAARSAAATARPRGLRRRTPTAIGRIIPTAGAPTSLRSAARVPRRMGIAAMPSSPLPRRAVTLRRGRILRPAAATRRRLVPTLHRAAATAAEEVTAEEAAIAAAEVATVVVDPAAAAAIVAEEAHIAVVVGVHMPVVAAAHMVAVEVALTKKSLNLCTKGPSGNSGRAFLILMSPFVFFFLIHFFRTSLLHRATPGTTLCLSGCSNH